MKPALFKKHQPKIVPMDDVGFPGATGTIKAWYDLRGRQGKASLRMLANQPMWRVCAIVRLEVNFDLIESRLVRIGFATDAAHFATEFYPNDCRR